MAASERPVRHVLVTRFSALGDVAMTIPVLYPVCRANPDVHFCMATRQAFAPLFVRRPDNLTVVGIDLDEHRGPLALARLASTLRHEHHIDALADLHSVMRTWIMGARLRCLGVSVERIDKGRRLKRQLIDGTLRRQLPTTHERYADVFGRLGLRQGQPFDTIFDAASTPDSAIVPAKQAGDRWIAVAPFAQHRGKAYPLKQMQQVIDTLCRWPSVQVLLFGGGQAERDAIAPITRRHSNAISVAHIKHTFADELALMSRCDVMLSMDSANMHLASLVGLPVVSVWGATHPWCGFMGWRQRLELAVQLDLDCRPCSVFGNKPCRLGDYRCLTGISPDQIVQKIKQVIEP